MRHFRFVAALFGAAWGAFAWGAEPDSAKVERLSEVVVQGVRAANNAPFAVSKIGGQELEQFGHTGQELPFLFARTPGVVAWSENGLGTGTTHMRIRGAAGSRINVTLDGVTLNSPEDQTVFWANMNSYATLLGSAQIQRGIGTSTGGDGAFGGTISLQSKTASLLPSLDLQASYGSYNTYNVGGNFSTGLLKNHWIVDGAYHHTGTDGYIHGTRGNSGSYYGGLTFLNTPRTLKLSYKNIGNYELTGQAWNGVTAGNGDYSLNAYDGIRTYRDMYDRGLGRYNSLYEGFVPDWNGGWTLNRYTLADGSLWERATDKFQQNHNLLSAAWTLSDQWSTSATLHYTYGYGYYREFRPNNRLSRYGLTSSMGLRRTDFVRQKGLEQHTYGLNWNASYRNRRWDFVGGTALQQFRGNHFGYLTYIADAALSNEVLQGGRYKYYDSDAEKDDYSLFAKATLHLNSHWDAFADVQYRHVRFQTDGINDRFVNGQNQRLDINKKYDFLNPKAGLSWHSGGHKAYLSYALAHREPERNNFTDNGSYPAPKAESMHDIEVGYSHHAPRWFASVGGYAMLYRNQFVQTGAQSDIGENLTTNIRRSHRLGLELQGGASPVRWLRLEANAALSLNKIKDFNEVVETYDDQWNALDATTIHYSNSTLSFSPTAILNGFADFRYKALTATWHTNFVSRQYLDNTENKQRSLPKYSQTNIRLAYELRIDRALKSATFGLNLNNIFNARYASSGWVYSAIVGSAYPNANRYHQIGYMPMAGFNVMGSVSVKF